MMAPQALIEEEPTPALERTAPTGVGVDGDEVTDRRPGTPAVAFHDAGGAGEGAEGNGRGLEKRDEPGGERGKRKRVFALKREEGARRDGRVEQSRGVGTALRCCPR